MNFYSMITISVAFICALLAVIFAGSSAYVFLVPGILTIIVSGA